MINLKKILKKPSLTYGLTGISPREFRTLSQKFDRIITSKREGNAGAEKELETAAEKLFFVLFYYTVHPTYTMIRALFGYSPRSAKTKIQQMTPAVEVVLHKHLHPAKHRVSTFRKLYSEFAIPKNIFTLGIPKWWKKKAEAEPAELTNEQEFVIPPTIPAPAPTKAPEPAAGIPTPAEKIHHAESLFGEKSDDHKEPVQPSNIEKSFDDQKQPLEKKESFDALLAAKMIETTKEEEREARIRELVNKEVVSQMESAKVSAAEKVKKTLQSKPALSAPP